MTRAYNVVDADVTSSTSRPVGQVHESRIPQRRPRFVIDDNGKERLSVEGKLLAIRGDREPGFVGARRASSRRHPEVCEGAKAGSTRTRASSTWILTHRCRLPLSQSRPVRGRRRGSRPCPGMPRL